MLVSASPHLNARGKLLSGTVWPEPTRPEAGYGASIYSGRGTPSPRTAMAGAGFVHEFRPLDAAAIRQLLEGRLGTAWCSPSAQPWGQEIAAAIIRITGDLSFANRLLTLME
jgi:hypothetical protein